MLSFSLTLVYKESINITHWYKPFEKGGSLIPLSLFASTNETILFTPIVVFSLLIVVFILPMVGRIQPKIGTINLFPHYEFNKLSLIKL